MAATIYADTTALLEAIATADEARIIAETLRLLDNDLVQPAAVAGRVGLAALWGGCEPHTLAAYSTIGRLATGMKAIPLGPEPGADVRRQLAPAIPLVQGFVAVADAVKKGLAAPHPTMPEPLLPDKVKSTDGPLGGLRDALAARNIDLIRQILLGFTSSGVDYRAMITLIYGALGTRYPEAGHPLIFARAGMDVLYMAGWGGNQEPFVWWYPPLMVDPAPDAPAAQVAQAFAAAPEHNLEWLRKRLSIPQDEAAGAAYQQLLLAGDGPAACVATLQALRNGATPRSVLAGMELAIAGRLLALPEGDAAGLTRVAHVLLYVHAISKLMTEVQDPVIWPTMFTAAAVTNTLHDVAGPAVSGRATASVPALPGGGLIAPTMLRTFEQQVTSGDIAGAQATARRYIQLGHSVPALAGTLSLAAALRDLSGADADVARHALSAAGAALEAYLNLPAALANGGQNTLLDAAIRLIVEARGTHALADRVRAAIAAMTA